jgi:hypothetical protein
VGRGVGEGRGVLVGVGVIVAVGWGVLVGAGVDVGGSAAAPQADNANDRINRMDKLKLTFGPFIVFSFLQKNYLVS